MQQHDATHPTGVVDDGNGTNGGLTRSRDRKANAALQLRAEGEDWEDIAAIIGYPSGQACRVATERALEKELKDESSKKHMRVMASKRLEALLKSVWHKATDPDSPEHLAAVDRARLLIDRHIKLYGLDAPTELVVNSPTQATLDAWVAKVLSSETPAVPEADIFDIEYTEDEGPSSESEPEEAHALPAR